MHGVVQGEGKIVHNTMKHAFKKGLAEMWSASEVLVIWDAPSVLGNAIGQRFG
jgi:hypothetical protein